MLCFFICFFWLLFLLVIFPFLFIFLFFWCLFLFGSGCVESCHSAVSSASSSSSFFLFFFFLFFLFWFYFSLWFSHARFSGVASLSWLLGCLLWGLCFLCLISFWSSDWCSCIFERQKCRPKKGASLFFVLCFPAFRAGGAEGSLLSWEVKKGNSVPSCRCRFFSFLCMDRKTLEI